ncbi:hypothetical protein SLEP1_g15126 [Rubroshorea leprosula]|uniref:Uncharacterized protein n=1 Tax=Rubroshorea leprosula TaxID=152421 RepID=A0AAV5ISB5_9ROSI|nr:hypothetical protein SLEP1_g15126 [Rubroshorea leprosula]
MLLLEWVQISLIFGFPEFPRALPAGSSPNCSFGFARKLWFLSVLLLEYLA